MTSNPDEPFPCPRCGSFGFEPGFVDDDRQGRIRWIAGKLERGPMGNARKLGLRKTSVIAYRCTTCSRLELYALQ
ncbi:hypothetical protein ABFT23_04375 [Nocardioides sp. C4-1]|uniref:hypothetical protein n=1 Tax=Nocardioides sp. C4-1 TaxID=3151851 RepID=UPI0032667830